MFKLFSLEEDDINYYYVGVDANGFDYLMNFDNAKEIDFSIYETKVTIRQNLVGEYLCETDERVTYCRIIIVMIMNSFTNKGYILAIIGKLSAYFEA